MAPPQTQYVTSGDVQLAYQVFGEGERDLIFVLDWASHLEVVWDLPFMLEFLDALGRIGRVLWFDMRGIGMSDPVPGGVLAVEDWVGDVAAVMDAAGFGRSTMIAQGHACQLALMAAATHPERIASLVLFNGFARLARADDYPAGMPEPVHDVVLEQIATTWGTGALAHILGPSVVDQPGIVDWWARVERFAGTPRMAASKARTIYELDLRNVLPLVAAPTLVVHARDNGYIRLDHGRFLAEHIAGARFVELDSADHWPLPQSGLLGAIEEFVTGSRVVADDADRVLATVLVVDVVGSTERATELGDRHWSDLRERFETIVRQGLLAHGDAGEIVRRVSGVSGIAVHIGARVSALANPGEVLVTRTVRDLVAGSGIAFEERGEHELKGVPDRWALYAAVG